MDPQALAVKRMAPFLGEDEARRAVADCMQARGLRSVDTPEAQLALAECLMKRGGVALLVGRTLKARAFESGAPLVN